MTKYYNVIRMCKEDIEAEFEDGDNPELMHEMTSRRQEKWHEEYYNVFKDILIYQ